MLRRLGAGRASTSGRSNSRTAATHTRRVAQAPALRPRWCRAAASAVSGSSEAVAPKGDLGAVHDLGPREPRGFFERVASPAERSRVKTDAGAGGGEVGKGVPIYVMLPLDTVTHEGTLQKPQALCVGCQTLAKIGVEGIMVDVWWGLVEKAPRQYDWSAYKQLLQMVSQVGLKVTAVMSFHACGANVGDVYDVTLPGWVLQAAKEDRDLFYSDQYGYHNPECLSLFADNAPTVAGRTPLQCYADFMRAFRREFGDYMGSTITEVSIGCGPCGELRYPAYPENKRTPMASQWRFPGIGEFQCYDRRALGALAKAAADANRIEWGGAGPHDSGGYNNRPRETGFFTSEHGSWDSEYGEFFLGWYSSELVAHGERMLQTATGVFDGSGATLAIKCAGVHWWYNSRSHAAELTAGYYNTRQGDRVPERNGYEPIVELCAKYDASLNFTCCEMRDAEHPYEARCGPEGLLRQVRATAAKYGVRVSGENALCRFDSSAYDRIIENCCGGELVEDADVGLVKVPPMAAFTFLRLRPELFDEHIFSTFVHFVMRLQAATGSASEPLVNPALPEPLYSNGQECETEACSID